MKHKIEELSKSLHKQLADYERGGRKPSVYEVAKALDKILEEGAEPHNASDRVAKIQEKLDSAIAIVEREIERVQEIQREHPRPHRVGLYGVETEYKLMLAEMKGEDVSWKLKPHDPASTKEPKQ